MVSDRQITNFGIKLIMNEDNSFDLRDRLALEVMQVLIKSYNEKQLKNDHHGLYSYYINSWDTRKEQIKQDLEINDERMVRIAQISYRIADIMRKARLTAFE